MKIKDAQKKTLARAAAFPLVLMLAACLNPVRADLDSNNPLGFLFNVLGLLKGKTVYFVSTTGSDSAAGRSATTPFLTISHALTEAQSAANAVIKIESGTYTEALNLVANNVTASAILAGGYPPGFASRNPYSNVTTITQATTASTVSITASSGSTTFTLDGFVITNTFPTTNSSGVRLTGGNKAVIRYSKISGGNGTAIADAVWVSSGSITLENNVLNPSSSGGGNTASGVRMDGGGTGIITNNIIATTVAPASGYGVFVDVVTGPGITIEHNSIDFAAFVPVTNSVGIEYTTTPPGTMLYNIMKIAPGGGQRFAIDTPGATPGSNNYNCADVPGLFQGGGAAAGPNETTGVVTFSASSSLFHDNNHYLPGGSICFDRGPAGITIAGVAATDLQTDAGGAKDTGNLDIGFHYNPAPAFGPDF